MGSAAVDWDELRAILRTAIEDPVVSDWFSSLIDLADVHPPVNSWPDVLNLIADSFTDNAYAVTRRRDRKAATSWQALATDAQVAAWVDALLHDLWLNTEDDPRPTMPADVHARLRVAIQQTSDPVDGYPTQK